jgi:hypothetical protein
MADQATSELVTLDPFEPGDPGAVTGWRFDFGAADAAADQLLLTAQSLLEAVGVLELDIPVVTEDWSGRFRDVFDVEMLRRDVSLRMLAEGLFVLATLVRAKAIEAAASWSP